MHLIYVPIFKNFNKISGSKLHVFAKQIYTLQTSANAQDFYTNIIELESIFNYFNYFKKIHIWTSFKCILYTLIYFNFPGNADKLKIAYQNIFFFLNVQIYNVITNENIQ